MGEDDHADGEPRDGEGVATGTDPDARRASPGTGRDPTGGDRTPPGADRDQAEALLHETEHALEWLHRARGHLLAFHHAVGRAMDKLAAAEAGFREAGHDDLADRIRDDLLPAGVTRRDAWSYEVVEAFEAGPLTEVERFEVDVRDRVADGERHVVERAQQERWRERAEE